MHKATIFCVSGLVASGFIAFKALNCGFVGLLRKARIKFIVVVCFLPPVSCKLVPRSAVT